MMRRCAETAFRPAPGRWVGVGLLLLLVTAPALRAQDGPGTTAATVLRLAPAPRPLALGGAYAALATDALAVFYNPARLSAAAPAAQLSYQSYPVDAAAGSAAAAMRVGSGVVGIGTQFLSYGEIRVMEPDPAAHGQRGRPTGERLGGGEVAVSAGYGVAWGGAFQVGATAKLLHLRLAEASATGPAVDLGASVELLDGGLVLAAAAQNLGRRLGPGTPAPLPRTLRGGAAVRLGDGVGMRVDLALEALHRAGRTRLASGLEFGYTPAIGRQVVARVGYDGRRPEAEGALPVTLGAGLGFGRLAVDYAYGGLGPVPVHQFGITIHTRP